MIEPTGSISAHGKTWPTYSREVVTIDVVGFGDASQNIEGLGPMIGSILRPYGYDVNFNRATLIEMSPEDQAEKNALDEKAVLG